MIKVIAKGIKLNDTPLKSYIKKHVGRLVDKFESIIVEDILISLHVNVENRHLSSVKIKIPVRGKDVFVTYSNSNMYKAVKLCAKKANLLLISKKRKNRGIDKRKDQNNENEDITIPVNTD